MLRLGGQMAQVVQSDGLSISRVLGSVKLQRFLIVSAGFFLLTQVRGHQTQVVVQLGQMGRVVTPLTQLQSSLIVAGRRLGSVALAEHRRHVIESHDLAAEIVDGSPGRYRFEVEALGVLGAPKKLMDQS